VGLRGLSGSSVAGIAVLSPNILDVSLTDVSVFIADGLFASAPSPTGDQSEGTALPIVIGEAAVMEGTSPGATPEANN
jgi:hypothetical protein